MLIYAVLNLLEVFTMVTGLCSGITFTQMQAEPRSKMTAQEAQISDILCYFDMKKCSSQIATASQKHNKTNCSASTHVSLF